MTWLVLGVAGALAIFAVLVRNEFVTYQGRHNEVKGYFYSFDMFPGGVAVGSAEVQSDLMLGFMLPKS